MAALARRAPPAPHFPFQLFSLQHFSLSLAAFSVGARIGNSLGDVCQFLVGRLLFAQRFFQQPDGLLVAHLFGPGSHRSVRGDFVVLNLLRGGDDTGVDRALPLKLLQEFGASLLETCNSRN